MASPQLHTPSTQVRPSERAGRDVNEQQGRPQWIRSRRIAIAATVAIGLGAGAAAIVPSTRHAAETISGGPGALSTQVPHVGATSASFVRRVHALEAQGYVQIACATGGDLMFNSRTHSSETVRSASGSARVASLGETSQSSVRRIRVLEVRGYVEVACQVGGDLMVNPGTHSSETVRA